MVCYECGAHGIQLLLGDVCIFLLLLISCKSKVNCEGSQQQSSTPCHALIAVQGYAVQTVTEDAGSNTLGVEHSLSRQCAGQQTEFEMTCR